MSILLRLMLLISVVSALWVSRCKITNTQNSCVSQLNSITEIYTQSEFEKLVLNSTSNILTVVDFQKSKCSPCIRIAPKLAALSNKFEGKVNFYKIDADTSPEAKTIMKSQGIRSVPTFHIWRKGSQLDSVQGAKIDEVERIIENELRLQS
jgi:thioredoxin 1